MKKILVTAAALSALSTSVYASKARILALGDEVEDNFFVEDARRIFTNAAQIHNYNNQVWLEWGSEGAVSNTLDADTDPKAMGGFLMDCGNMICGVYMGNESNISSSLRMIGTDVSKTQGGSLATADNQIDLFIGGDNGIKWGVDFIYTSDEDKLESGKKREDSAMALKMGVLENNWEAYVNVSLNSESKVDNGYTNTTADLEFDGKFGLQLGGSIDLADNREAFISAKKFTWDQKSDSTTTEGGLMSYRLGYGKNFEVAGNGHAFIRGFYESIEVSMERSGVDKGELNRTRLPLVIGYEAKATDWLTLRGSVTHNLHGKVEGKNLSTYLSDTGTAVDTIHEVVANNYNALEGSVGSGTYLNGEKSLPNSTTVAAGATLNFGKLAVDGFVGSTAGSRTGDIGSNEGIFSTDNLMTRVGMTYSF